MHTFKTLVLSVSVVLSSVAAGVAVQDPYDACLNAVNGAGYRGGGMQLFCEHNYLLPSPFLVRCTRGMTSEGNIGDAKLKQLCQVHCEVAQYFGPWADYPQSDAFEAGWHRFAELAAAGRCSEL